ncbi:MAG: radical SAM family heme chaperone HemW [Rhodospirillales bacterium]
MTAADPLAIYVHWPFCRSKCPYCDFNSHVAAAAPDQDRWRRAYLSELARFAEMAGREGSPARPVASVFFGGGTPSLVQPAVVGAVLDAIAGLWGFTADAEITLEANPTSAEAGRFAGYRLAGVNRLSLGVQALDDRDLAFLGRHHTAREAVAALDLAARHLPRVSLDLIYARPGQTAAGWQRELTEAIHLAGDHLSVYQLTVEPGTAFHRQGLVPLGDDAAADLYELTQSVLESAGLPAYEISNHARPGGACRHNLAIWQGGDYLGVGPGAHGRISRAGRCEAWRCLNAPDRWLTAVEGAGHGLAARTALTASERIEELLMLGLRLTGGIDRGRFAARTGRDPLACMDARGLAALVDAGFVTVDATSVRATAAGRLRLNAVVGRLLLPAGMAGLEAGELALGVGDDGDAADAELEHRQPPVDITLGQQPE